MIRIAGGGNIDRITSISDAILISLQLQCSEAIVFHPEIITAVPAVIDQKLY